MRLDNNIEYAMKEILKKLILSAFERDTYLLQNFERIGTPLWIVTLSHGLGFEGALAEIGILEHEVPLSPLQCRC